MLVSFTCFRTIFDLFWFNMRIFDENGFIWSYSNAFNHMSMKQTHSCCSNEVFVINRGLIWSNFDYLLLLHVFQEPYKLLWSNMLIIASHWIEFNHMGMKKTYSSCFKEVFVINWGLNWFTWFFCMVLDTDWNTVIQYAYLWWKWVYLIPLYWI